MASLALSEAKKALPGFHIHNEGKVVANDTEGRERLARYIIRPPVSLERLAYDREGQQVFYQGKDQTSTYDPLDFLAYVSLHIPDKGEQLLRYYGWYSNKSRGLRKAVPALSEAKNDRRGRRRGSCRRMPGGIHCDSDHTGCGQIHILRCRSLNI